MDGDESQRSHHEGPPTVRRADRYQGERPRATQGSRRSRAPGEGHPRSEDPSPSDGHSPRGRRSPSGGRSRLTAVIVLISILVVIAIVGVGVGSSEAGSSTDGQPVDFRLLPLDGSAITSTTAPPLTTSTTSTTVSPTTSTTGTTISSNSGPVADVAHL
jgi:hypothetical protein